MLPKNSWYAFLQELEKLPGCMLLNFIALITDKMTNIDDKYALYYYQITRNG